MSAPSVLRGKYFEGSGVVGIFIGTVHLPYWRRLWAA